jgi:hypothetical protein
LNLFLKSLVYFDELREEPIQFLPGHSLKLDTVKSYLTKQVKKYSAGEKNTGAYTKA